MRNILLGISASLGIVVLLMLGLICCNHNKSYIDVEKVLDSVANEALNDTTLVIETADSISVSDSTIVID